MEEYCKGCSFWDECKGEAYQYGDCASAGPWYVDKDLETKITEFVESIPDDAIFRN